MPIIRLCNHCYKEVANVADNFQFPKNAVFYHPKCKVEAQKIRDKKRRELRKSGL